MAGTARGGGTVLMGVYSLLVLAVLVLGSPWWLLRMLTSGRYRAGLGGRLGRVPAEVAAAGARAERAGQRLVWLHAVSVGEVLAATALVAGLQEAGLEVVVSTTTQAGQELARRRFAGCAVFYMPLDLGVLVRRYLRALRPSLVVTMESELWPNVILSCRRAGVPLAVVNARVSDRSFPRYMRLRRVWGPLLREVTVFLAQSEETADRLRQMGVAAERVRVTGNLKFDVKAGAATAMTERLRGWAQQLDVELVVAGSTLQGEEEALLEVWLEVQRACARRTGAAQDSQGRAALLVMAPRHTDRFEAVEGLVGRLGYVAVRCSTLPEAGGGSVLSGNVVLLLDTIGDLASVYSLGAVAFVGGSLVARGGHNPLEPAQFGVPVVMGPSYTNFKEIVGAMRVADAIRIVEPQQLQDALTQLLTERAAAEAMGSRGQQVFAAQAGATGRTMTALLELTGSSGRVGFQNLNGSGT